MANFHAYRCTYRGPGSFAVGDRMMEYGDTIVLTDEEAARKVRTSDLTGKHLEYLGEVDSASGYFSTNVQEMLDGKQWTLKKNVLPAVTIDIPLPDTAFDAAGAKVLSDYNIQRRLMLDKVVSFQAVLPASGDGAGTLNTDNRVHMLLTKGDSGEATQITTNGWTDDNGTLETLGLPLTTTVLDSFTYLQDTIYVGHTSKFSGVYVDVVAGSPNGNGGYIYSVSYWNGTGWTAFENVADTTVRAGAPLGGDGWIAWFEQPVNWATTNATASAHRVTAVNSSTALATGVYWVAIQYVTDGSATTLDADTEINRIWVPGDEPLAEISISAVKDGEKVIASRETFDSVVQQDDTTLNEVSSSTSAMITDWPTPAAADDALYLGYNDVFAGVVVDVGTTVNDAVSTLTASYWNGAEWVDLGATDGTNSVADTLKVDGAVTWSIPAGWRVASATSAMMDSQTLDTDTTEDVLFWVRLTWDGNLTNLFDINRVYPLRSATVPIEFNVTANIEVAPSDFLNIYVGEIEAETDALSGVTLQLVGADI